LQWINFAAWLPAGALVFAGAALLWAAVEFLRKDRVRDPRSALYLVLIATFVLGFVNALAHAKDAWATMPTALILSVFVFLLALAATWLGFAGHRTESRA
jgi:uncharacterized membrane protein